ncbi:MAG: hypothetical protein GXP47_01640 [Acidobacteria bacterium]|nr:hypothetical protein [Acidobacteriota bacterium]
MNCHELELRLYDEDCRCALLGEAPLPRDVQAHLGRCPACRKTWSDAATDTARLSHELLFDPPPSLLTPPRSVGSEQPSFQELIGWPELSWGLTAGAVLATFCGLLPAALPWCQWTGFWTGAAIGLAAAVLERAGIALFPEWT